jgi:exosome complex component RRP4
LKGRYEPVVGDFVIGIVEEASTSNWMVDINAPYPALLHVNEVPWEIEFADTEKYLNTGDTILAKVLSVDVSKKLQITLKDRNLFKLKGGHLIEFEPSIYRRIIGKKYSMIEIIQKYTRCRIKVGKNGRIWIEGDADGIQKVLLAISKIESEAITFGLTDRIEELLKKDAKDVR